jgi:hypothetical protein
MALPTRLLARSDTNNSPFLRRKSPRSSSQIDTNETLFKLASTAVSKTDAAQMMRTLAAVPFAVEGSRTEQWEYATDQDAFFEGTGPELAARRPLLELCMQLNERAAFEHTALRLREWWPAPRFVAGLEACVGVLRAASEPGVAVVAASLRNALAASGVAIGDAPVRWSVVVRVRHEEGGRVAEVVHTRAELAVEEQCEVVWSVIMTLDSREAMLPKAAHGKKSVDELRLARLSLALVSCEKRQLAKTVSDLCELMSVTKE